MGANFSSIELEVYSDTDLAVLEQVLSGQVSTGYCGATQDGCSWAYWYAGGYSSFVDEDILPNRSEESDPFEQGIERSASELCDLLESLDGKAKSVWYAAGDRVFDVGLDANLDRTVVINFLSPETMDRMGKLGVRLAVSVYARNFEDEINKQGTKICD